MYVKFPEMLDDEWLGCYRNKPLYAKLSDPESFKHPAKMAWGLLDRIFKELKKMGLLQEDDVILDFMSGVGRTNIWAGLKGYKSISIELESHFIEMQENNKEFAESKFPKKWDWEIVQGDARELSKLLQEKNLVAVISPPYGRGVEPNRSEPMDKKEDQKSFGGPNSVVRATGYQGSENNIGNLPDRGLVGITSPPYENSEGTLHPSKFKNPEEFAKKMSELDKGKPLRHGRTSEAILAQMDRAAIELNAEGQIGNQQGETYLLAMASAYAEAAKVCKVLVTVTKNPTRAGKLRRLDLDTIQLCQNAGFVPIAWFRARLFEKQTQGTLDNGTITNYKGRISFFKRLSLAKGNVAAEWEDVVFFVNKNNGGAVGITSPPYPHCLKGCGSDSIKKRIAEGRYTGKRPDVWTSKKNIAGSTYGDNYSEDPRNIGNLD